MKIGLVSPYDFAVPGGVGAHIQHLAVEFERLGHQLKIIAPSSVPIETLGVDNFIRMGVPVPVPGGGSWARLSFSLWLFPKAREVLEREQFDILHLHEPLVPIVPLAFLQYSNSVNIGTFHACHDEGSKAYTLAKYISTVWHLDERLHARIAVSPAARDFINRYFPSQYGIIPNGIEYQHFARPAEAFPQYQDGKLNLLFVGRGEKRKGLKYVLGAYRRLKWNYPDIRLLVVGPGNPDKESARIMGECNLQDVVFTGWVPYADLPRYYQTADIYCAPATGKESFGIVLLEAMAAGCPIVASNIDGYAAVLENEKQGLLVQPQDEEALASGIATLIDDPPMRRRMGANGPGRARPFRWEIVASQVLEFYKETARQVGRSSASPAPRAY